MLGFIKVLNGASYADTATMLLAQKGVKLEPSKFPRLPEYFHKARTTGLSSEQAAQLLMTMLKKAAYPEKGDEWANTILNNNLEHWETLAKP